MRRALSCRTSVWNWLVKALFLESGCRKMQNSPSCLDRIRRCSLGSLYTDFYGLYHPSLCYTDLNQTHTRTDTNLGFDLVVSEAEMLKVGCSVGLHRWELVLQHLDHLWQLRISPTKLSAQTQKDRDTCFLLHFNKASRLPESSQIKSQTHSHIHSHGYAVYTEKNRHI